MFKKASKTFVILSITMGASFVATILMGRELSPNKFGIYNLIKKFILVGPAIGCLGMNRSLTKIYAKTKKIPNKVFYFIYTIGLLTSLIIAFIIFHIYEFNYLHTILIFVVMWMTVITKFNTQYYRINDRYLVSEFVSSGWKLTLLIIISISLLFSLSIENANIPFLFVLAYIIPTMIIFFYLSPFQTNAINTKFNFKELVSYGIIYWIVSSIRLLNNQIDKFTIPIVASNKLLGIYTALSFFFIISLKVVTISYGYVIFPEVSKGKKINWKNIIILLTSVSVIALTIFPLFGRQILNLLFSGKYNQYIKQEYLVIFACIGIMRAIYSILHYYIIGKSKKNNLIIYIITSLASTFLYLTLIILLNNFYTVNLHTLIYSILVMRVIDILLILFVVWRIGKKQNLSLNAN